MSYTVYLHKSPDTIDNWSEDLVEDKDYIDVSNITFNLREMFNFAFSGTELSMVIDRIYWVDVLHKQRCKDVETVLREAVSFLESKEQFARKYDAPNGWGTYESALRFLDEVLESCAKYPEYYINVSK